MTKCVEKFQNFVYNKNLLSYSKQTGLRSMQNIKGAEREIIETYRSELSHEIWGNPKKMLEWVLNKFSALKETKYKSNRKDGALVEKYRTEEIEAWAEVINKNELCKNNPFLKLKIFKSIISDLKENNSLLPPVINEKIFNHAVNEVRKFGASFKKVYFKLYKEFCSIDSLKTQDVSINGIRGKWYSIKLPDYAEAAKEPGRYKKALELLSVLSQGSNWCTRNSKILVNDFAGNDFHIFVDSKGIPQLCLTGHNNHGGRFKYIKGNDQYAKIEDKYKEVLRDFINQNKFENALVGETDQTLVPIADIIK